MSQEEQSSRDVFPNEYPVYPDSTLRAKQSRHCEECLRFQKEYRHEPRKCYKIQASLDLLKGSATSGCPLCGILYSSLLLGSPRFGRPSVVEEAWDVEDTISVQVCVRAERHVTLSVHCDEKTCYVPLESLDESLADELRKPRHTETIGLGTGSSQAFDLARFWLKTCSIDHNECCAEGERTPALPRRIIFLGSDLRPSRIQVSCDAKAPYCALSYCWGQGNSVVLTKSNLAEFTCELPLQSLSTTIRDAMYAARKLGFKYLWVDALCICQDDAADWEQEASNMQNIYANSTLKISADRAEDSSQTMFASQEFQIQPMRLDLHLPLSFRKDGELSGSTFAFRSDAHQHRWSQGPTGKRGWILQEQMLSRKTLYFTSSILRWECERGTASEVRPYLFDHGTSGGFEIFLKPFLRGGSFHLSEKDREDMFRNWSGLVERYSGLQLSYTKDKIPAMLGIINRLSTVMQDEAIAGNWLNPATMVQSLAWFVDHDCNPGLASTSRQERRCGTSSNLAHPSWSWTSVNGPVKHKLDDFWYYLEHKRREHAVFEAVINKRHSNKAQSRVVASLETSGVLLPMSCERFWTCESNRSDYHSRSQDGAPCASDPPLHVLVLTSRFSRSRRIQDEDSRCNDQGIGLILREMAAPNEESVRPGSLVCRRVGLRFLEGEENVRWEYDTQSWYPAKRSWEGVMMNQHVTIF